MTSMQSCSKGARGLFV